MSLLLQKVHACCWRGCNFLSVGGTSERCSYLKAKNTSIFCILLGGVSKFSWLFVYAEVPNFRFFSLNVFHFASGYCSSLVLSKTLPCLWHIIQTSTWLLGAFYLCPWIQKHVNECLMRNLIPCLPCFVPKFILYPLYVKLLRVFAPWLKQQLDLSRPVRAIQRILTLLQTNTHRQSVCP